MPDPFFRWRQPSVATVDAASREAVHQFYEAALAHGGADNGPPGLREHYGPNYYAAFVIDPEGWRVEAVINAPA